MKNLPNSQESERYVLQLLISEPENIATVRQIVTSPKCFYNQKYEQIASFIYAQADELKEFDMITISNRFPEYVIDIANLFTTSPSGGRLEEHCRIIFELYCRREIAFKAEKLKTLMFDTQSDFFDGLTEFDEFTKNLFSFTQSDDVHIKDAAKEAMAEAFNIAENGKTMNGIPTGFSYFDNFSGGLGKGDLVVVAGEPSNGKTTFALDVIHYAAKYGKVPCGIFSYEMTKRQLANRLIAIDQNVSSKALNGGKYDTKTLIGIDGQLGGLSNANIRVFRPSSNEFSVLVNDINRSVKIHGLKLIVVDYLQLISIAKAKGNDERIFAKISNDLKNLAVRLDITIVLVSQLARTVKGMSPKPTISRLKGSGDIENAADTIIMLFVPWKNGFYEFEVNGTTIDVTGKAIAYIGKGRNIGTGEFLLATDFDKPTFKNPSVAEFNGYQPQQDNFIEANTEFDEPNF
jgi:replicative DNA helicase